jgi:hypothetical protein
VGDIDVKLTADEMGQIQTSLNRRFSIKKDKNLVGIGFGPAVRRGRKDKKRPLAVCFLVKKKEVVSDEKMFPREVTVKIKKGKASREVTLPTDVVAVGRITKTGEDIRFSNKDATVGAVVAWNDGTEHWGVLVVAHLMAGGTASIVGVGDSATVRGPVSNFTGALRLKSTTTSGMDVALLEVNKSALLSNGLIKPSQSQSRKFVRSVDSLATDGDARGQTFSKFGTRVLMVTRYHPTFFVTGLGDLKDIIEVRNAWAAETFREGSSGAAWHVNDESACMQVAGEDRLVNAFQVGYGQALATVLSWVKEQLRSKVQLKANSFRLVVTF